MTLETDSSFANMRLDGKRSAASKRRLRISLRKWPASWACNGSFRFRSSEIESRAALEVD